MTTPPEKEVPRPAIVKFRASTALAVPAPQIFPSDAGIVTVTNWTERDGAGDRHRGLLVEVALDAADPADAVRRGLSPASFTLPLLSFAGTGPEALTRMLAKRGGLATARQIAWKTCHALSDVPDVTGIIDLVTRHFGDEEATHLRRFRQQFMHSTRPLHELVDDARRATRTAVETPRSGRLELFWAPADQQDIL